MVEQVYSKTNHKCLHLSATTADEIHDGSKTDKVGKQQDEDNHLESFV